MINSQPSAKIKVPGIYCNASNQSGHAVMFSHVARKISNLLFVTFSLCSCGYLLETEETITFEQLPDNIQFIAKLEISDSTITSVEKEMEFGKTVYVIKYLVENVLWEVEFNDKGELLEKNID